MTDDEEAKRMAELVEKVARALSEDRGYDWDKHVNFRPAFRRMARAAIAVLRPALRADALEEAAKLAAAHMNPFDIRFGGDGIEIAAAIRALKEDSNGK